MSSTRTLPGPRSSARRSAAARSAARVASFLRSRKPSPSVIGVQHRTHVCVHANLRVRSFLLSSLVMTTDFLLGGDLRVHRLGLGAMRLALGGRVKDPKDGIAILRRAAEIGVN